MAKIEVPGGTVEMRESLGKAPRKLVKKVQEVQAEMASLPMFGPMLEQLQKAEGKPVAEVLRSVPAASPEDIARMIGLMGRVQEAQILALVASWSFDQPISADGLDELPQEVFDVLSAEAEKRSRDTDDSKAALLDPTPGPEGSNA